jgi:hypothetical protein
MEKNMSISVSTAHIKEALIDVLNANLVPNLLGSPGIGKSDIIRSIAEKNNFEIIDIRLSQMDPADLNGFPFIDKENNKAGYMAMNTFPLEKDPLPKGKAGWLIFLDEFNSAPLSVQAAAYKLILDRAVGMHKLHPNVAIIAAGNKGSDKAIVSRQSTAMQSRMIHFELDVDFKAWMNWATDNKIDERIKSFINFKPSLLHAFDPDHDDHTFPCPRTWHFLSRIISKWKDVPISKLAILAGTIGEGAAREFYSFTQIYKELISFEEIMANPITVDIPESPATKFAIAGRVAEGFDNTTGSQLMLFVERMPVEFQIIILSHALKIDHTIQTLPEVQAWIIKKGKEFQL